MQVHKVSLMIKNGCRLSGAQLWLLILKAARILLPMKIKQYCVKALIKQIKNLNQTRNLKKWSWIWEVEQQQKNRFKHK